jgi:hypothetical protein
VEASWEEGKRAGEEWLRFGIRRGRVSYFYRVRRGDAKAVVKKVADQSYVMAVNGN